MRKLKRVALKEELVELTGDYKLAIVLQQLIYWSERVKDFDKFLSEEKNRREAEGKADDIELTNGWIYKTAEELSEETMMGISKTSMRSNIKKLVDMEFISERINPMHKWDKTKQYRVNLVKIQSTLMDMGFSLEEYPLITVNDRSPKNEHRGLKNEPQSSKNELRNNKNKTAIPETTTETTTEITTHSPEEGKKDDPRKTFGEEEIKRVECVLDKKINLKDSKKLLTVAKGDINLIKAKYQIAKQTGYRNLTAYMITAIKEDWDMPKSDKGKLKEDKPAKQTAFHNFEQRSSKYGKEEIDKLIARKQNRM